MTRESRLLWFCGSCIQWEKFSIIAALKESYNPLKGLAQMSLLFTTCCLEVVMWHHLTARGNVGQPMEHLAGISVATKASHRLYSHCAHLLHCPPSPGHTGSSSRLCRRWYDQITIDNMMLPKQWSRWEHLIESLAFRWVKHLNHPRQRVACSILQCLLRSLQTSVPWG